MNTYLDVKAAGWRCTPSGLYYPGFEGGGTQGPPGDEGDVGMEGNAGDKGPTGDKGATGDPGADGSDGTDGTNGTNGDVGDKGPTGDTGADGADVVVSQGTFTPEIWTGVNGPTNHTSITLSKATGKYVKVGKMVQGFVHCVVNTAIAPSNNLWIAALPFTANSADTWGAVGTMYNMTGTEPFEVLLSAFPSQTYLKIERKTNTATLAQIAANVTSGTVIMLAFKYKTT